MAAAAAETLAPTQPHNFPHNEVAIVRVESDIQRSFDVNASVNLMRRDIRKDGSVHPETRQRVYDEELTLIAEGINRPLYSAFKLREENGSLVYFHKGKWHPYIGTLLTGERTAQSEADQDRRKKFLHDRAVYDLEIGYAMQALEPGHSMSWNSPFPEKECQMYGTKFIAAQGFQTSRRMGFLYRAEKLDDGSLLLESRSVDNSDYDAFQAVSTVTGQENVPDLDAQTKVYDEVLGLKHGREYKAGRLAEGIEEEACAFIKKHGLVFDYYIDQIEQLASSEMTGSVLERAKKRLTYGTWALIKELLDEETPTNQLNQLSSSVNFNDTSAIGARIQQAYINASLRYEIMIGCGGSISGESLLDASIEDAFDSIFGKNTDNSKSTTMKCVNCPKCQTFHEVVKPIKGKYRCKDKACGYEVSAT